MARNFRRHRTSNPISDLNVTNLIDLGFMLLIIFMVVAVSTQEQTIPIKLPIESKSAQTKPDPDDKFESITIRADGTVNLSGRVVTIAQLARDLTMFAGQPKPPVFRIRMDATTTAQQFVTVMDELKKKKLLRVMLDTQMGN